MYKSSLCSQIRSHGGQLPIVSSLPTDELAITMSPGAWDDQPTSAPRLVGSNYGSSRRASLIAGCHLREFKGAKLCLPTVITNTNLTKLMRGAL